MSNYKAVLATGLLAFATLAIMGCGGLFADLYPHEDIQYYYTPSPEEAQRMAKNATVECGNSGDGACSSSVALLTGTFGAEAYQCTAFLVSPQIMITNSHCIPRDLAGSGSRCVGRIWMHFPDTGTYPNQSARCLKVVKASTLVGLRVGIHGDSYDKIQPDYAVIELDRPVFRPTLSISRAGFKVGQGYGVDKVDPSGRIDGIDGLLNHVTCDVLSGDQASTKGADITNRDSSNIFFQSCNLIPGNSGAPIMDSKGLVRGVFQAISIPKDARFGSQDLTQRLELMNVAPRLATNFACLDLPAIVGAPAIASSCGQAAVADEYRKNRIGSPQTLRQDEPRDQLAAHPRALARSVPKRQAP